MATQTRSRRARTWTQWCRGLNVLFHKRNLVSKQEAEAAEVDAAGEAEEEAEGSLKGTVKTNERVDDFT